ncbi:MAG: hypothetical protein ABI896_06375 [Actinomycetota bacterium]
MAENTGERTLLGALLAQQGEVTSAEVDDALTTQVENGDPLGEILVERGAVSRPALHRALARQSGVELHFEGGFGSGLRTAIEERHRARRRLDAA